MKTDIFIRVVSETGNGGERERDIDGAFRMFREFESRFSRFRPESELSRFNDSEEMMRISPEFFDILGRCLRYHEETDGIFDPSVLPALEREGYGGSFKTEAFGVPRSVTADGCSLRDLRLDPATQMVSKPVGLRIDLGGIGKGYVVDRVAEFLRGKYEHFFVYAGGDIYAGGKNREAGYDYWAVDVENPILRTGSLVTLLLSNMAVATSGTERRRWSVGGEERHHLIDPRTERSARTDLVSATVVAETTERAEVFSKTLVILGSDRAKEFAEANRISALLVTRDGKTIYNSHIEPYVWKPS